MFIKTIQRGTRRGSGDPDGIYYGVSHKQDARKPDFVVHSSQVWDAVSA